MARPTGSRAMVASHLHERSSGPEFVEQVLVEGYQPALGDLAVGDTEHSHGLPGPQLAVALQLAVGQLGRPLVVGQDGAWSHPEGRLGMGPAGGEIAQYLLVA